MEPFSNEINPVTINFGTIPLWMSLKGLQLEHMHSNVVEMIVTAAEPSDNGGNKNTTTDLNVGKKGKGKAHMVVDTSNSPTMGIPISPAALGGFRRRRGRPLGSQNKLGKKFESTIKLSTNSTMEVGNKKMKVYGNEQSGTYNYYTPNTSDLGSSLKKSHGSTNADSSNQAISIFIVQLIENAQLTNLLVAQGILNSQLINHLQSPPPMSINNHATTFSIPKPTATTLITNLELLLATQAHNTTNMSTPNCYDTPTAATFDPYSGTDEHQIQYALDLSLGAHTSKDPNVALLQIPIHSGDHLQGPLQPR
ncbi:hypothetical protein FRX31_014783 [Thalictrum thalictroides]|uniref:DUF4283 domain-containing protein n=1 Tax=Thalictrum thalictroides TaxID=46969 RepID=A0A7J6WG92_THATH|nr:hypothetical protein FRX31_014783 [Thalictrum thalictroides]